MSFYGSTYFQLIDAFGKIFFTNTGRENVDFYTPTADAVGAAEAVGRKGFVQLQNGNRWIVLKKDGDNTFSFWHGAPDKTDAAEVSSVTKIAKKPEDATVTSLSSGDILQVPTVKYDKAGHIAAVTNNYVSLPIIDIEGDISDLEERIDELEKTVGLVPPDEGEEIDEEGLLARVEAVEEATEDVTLDVGDVRGGIFPSRLYYPANSDYSVASAIGDIETLRQDRFGNSPLSLCDMLEKQQETIGDIDEDRIFLVREINRLDEVVKELTARLDALETTE